MGWEPDPGCPPIVLVLDDGTILFPSRDAEGNGPGSLFAVNPEGRLFILVGRIE